MKLSKKQKEIQKAVVPGKAYTLREAIDIIQKFKSPRFDETVDIAVNLGIDPRKSDQMIRTSTILPNGTGKTVRVAVFAQGDNATKAKEAGADLVGFEDLAEQIKQGVMDFDVVIATPDAMRIVGQLGQILGPRGLMPNPKVGTVTTNVAAAVQNAKSGQVRYKTDKQGTVHCLVGKLSFEAKHLIENIIAIISDIKKAKPATSKGIYLKKIVLTSTMGPGLILDLSSLSV